MFDNTTSPYNIYNVIWYTVIINIITIITVIIYNITLCEHIEKTIHQINSAVLESGL